MTRQTTLFGIATGLALSLGGAAIADGHAGDAANGEKVFRKCKACHQVGEGAQAKAGPVLNGIIGRTAGASEGFKYSDAIIEQGAGGLVWTAETLDEFLTKPKSFIKGTKMSFAGLRKDDDRADVIAYLATFGE